jgi:hypothetical protein
MWNSFLDWQFPDCSFANGQMPRTNAGNRCDLMGWQLMNQLFPDDNISQDSLMQGMSAMRLRILAGSSGAYEKQEIPPDHRNSRKISLESAAPRNL